MQRRSPQEPKVRKKREAQSLLRERAGPHGSCSNTAALGVGFTAKFVALLHRFPFQCFTPPTGSPGRSRGVELEVVPVGAMLEGTSAAFACEEWRNYKFAVFFPGKFNTLPCNPYCKHRGDSDLTHPPFRHFAAIPKLANVF
ncbi:Hypothetical protein SMAX5B_021903 [Scophthalmus maximus]|uniref:Uncharacterized protein n=1 Tax=Scophthalmus maximus TaxID=52904 RepID=A0A2U9CIA8_SCOMX|nr:Hypothetical protein SMAX5B_021903 [Scophthalmus maximus]